MGQGPLRTAAGSRRPEGCSQKRGRLSKSPVKETNEATTIRERSVPHSTRERLQILEFFSGRMLVAWTVPDGIEESVDEVHDVLAGSGSLAHMVEESTTTTALTYTSIYPFTNARGHSTSDANLPFILAQEVLLQVCYPLPATMMGRTGSNSPCDQPDPYLRSFLLP